MVKAREDEWIGVSLSGPFKMWAPDGSQIHIASEMSRRLIAVLLLSNGMQRSRSALQLLFWDENSCNPASNLRQLLHKTRERLGLFADHLHADHTTITLLNTRNITQRSDRYTEEFFEDSGIGSEEFEDWHRTERAAYENLPVIPAGQQPDIRRRPRPTVGLVIAEKTLTCERSWMIADWVSHRIRDVFVMNAFVDFIDGHNTETSPLCDMELRVSTHQLGIEYELSIASYANGVCQQSNSLMLSAKQTLGQQRNQILEFAHRAASAAETRATQLTVGDPGELFTNLTRLFRVDQDDVTQAVSDFTAALKREPTAVSHAWLAFARILQWEERQVTDHSIVMQKIETLVDRAKELDPLDLTTLSVQAYFKGCIDVQHGIARELSDEALERAPFSPFAHHVRSVISLHNSDLEAAEHHNRIAMRLGHYGPMRHYITGTQVILSCLSGAHEEAKKSGLALLHRKPRFLSVLRHIVPSLLELGDYSEAERQLVVLRRIEPEYGNTNWGFETIGLSDLSRTFIRNRQQNYISMEA